jgi:hypothetical protein
VNVDTCERGHPFTPQNTYRPPTDGRKRCRECQAISRRRRERNWRKMASVADIRAHTPNDELTHIRIPVEPLLAYFARRNISTRATFHPTTLRLVDRARRAGHISLGSADGLCVSLGIHPCEVWGDAWFSYGETA